METPCDITQEDTMFDVEMVSLSIPPFTSSFSLSQDHDSTQADPTPLITATPTLCPCHCLRDNMTNVCADKLDVMMLTMFEYIEGVCFNEGNGKRDIVYWRRS